MAPGEGRSPSKGMQPQSSATLRRSASPLVVGAGKAGPTLPRAPTTVKGFTHAPPYGELRSTIRTFTLSSGEPYWREGIKGWK